MPVVMHVGTLAVLLFLFLASVVVAVAQLIVVVGMGMPVGLVVPLTSNATTVLMCNMVVVVTMCRRIMGMVGFPAFAFSALWRCHSFPPGLS